MPVTIIGIDCAVDEKNIGVAVGEYFDGGCTITKMPVRKQGEIIAQMVSGFPTSLLEWSRRAFFPTHSSIRRKALIVPLTGFTINSAARQFFEVVPVRLSRDRHRFECADVKQDLKA